MRAWLLVLFIAVPCQGARNPFIPLPDPCTSPFQGWVLRGISQTSGGAALALVSTHEGWVRLQPGAEPLPGWQVADIAEGSVVMQAQSACAPVRIQGPAK
ncbi:DUF2531 family protein [Enterobacteriaceae bacterium 4M9]|nr:DUF2531 family protein [Enterobacteriaceae bacterium 4M9]